MPEHSNCKMTTADIDTDKNVWAVTPKYLLRKDCVEGQINDWKPGGFVEFGAGTGNFTRIFLDRGYHGVCFDISEANCRTIAANLKPYSSVSVIDNLDDIEGTSYDYVIAVEVLEHINNDEQALKRWTEFLKMGGRILLTVPAHQKKFGPDDEEVGHVRRYEKNQLYDLMEACGYGNVEILNYGFPLGNITRVLRNLMLRRESRAEECSDAVELSKRSGRSRPKSILKLSFLFRKSVLWPFLIMQRLTWKMDWGDGYVITAVKTDHGQL